jgi:HAMP domain-containing protein
MESTSGFGPSELVEALQETVNRLTEELEQSRNVAHDEAERAQARLDEQRNHYDERLITQRDRWHAEVQAKQERLEDLLGTEQGQAWAEVENMKREVERMTNRAELALERAKQAEQDRDRALASVAGGEDIHPSDPRVAHIWRKASRIASNAGFCSEYDRIADALGLPEIEFDYYGTVSVRVSAYVSVPVSGTATRAQIADNEVDWEIENSDILDQMESDSIEWEVDEVEIEADDE